MPGDINKIRALIYRATFKRSEMTEINGEVIMYRPKQSFNAHDLVEVDLASINFNAN